MVEPERLGTDKPTKGVNEIAPPIADSECRRARSAERPDWSSASGLGAGIDGVAISVVIPARNEEQLIPRTIGSIHDALRYQYTYEVIVVDNGSVDSTPHLAEAHGARVISQSHGTIGSLRNTGARLARGQILVFLDADVLLTDDWAQRISRALELLADEPKAITGSLCDVPADASWIERTWFAPRKGRYFSHIGTGHMIVSRRFFDLLGGFDQSLTTGEDYDLSRRARSQGASIVIDPLLRVEHLGFPKTLAAFIKREIWHGTSDFRSITDVMRSKVALIAVLITWFHALVVAGALLGAPIIAGMGLIAIAAVCVLSSGWKYRSERFHVIAVNSLLFYFYYLARSVSAFYLSTRASRD